MRTHLLFMYIKLRALGGRTAMVRLAKHCYNCLCIFRYVHPVVGQHLRDQPNTVISFFYIQICALGGRTTLLGSAQHCIILHIFRCVRWVVVQH